MLLHNFFNQIKLEIQNSQNLNELDKIRIKVLGKRSYFSIYLKKIQTSTISERKRISIQINIIKNKVQEIIKIRKEELENKGLHEYLKKENIDVSLPGRRIDNGSVHPITAAIYEIEAFFCRLGFKVVYGPEIESEYYNFEALNIPKYHPSRKNHDTFWFDTNRLLRTQTSHMQIRVMEKDKPPLKVIVPGKVYRNDCDVTHTPMFHQIEGLVVNTNISFSNLKWIMINFLRTFFKRKLNIRFRSSFFPFTVPSAEIDIQWKNDKWLEVLGCGMVHPNVLKHVKLDPKQYSACAFGIGVERIVMLRHNILDIRSFFENDLRFIQQFK